jgi:hypothetical protein
MERCGMHNVIVLFVGPFGFASRLERPKAKTLNPLSIFKHSPTEVGHGWTNFTLFCFGLW